MSVNSRKSRRPTARRQTELGNAARYDLVGQLTEALKKRFPVTIHHDVLDKLL